MGIVAGSLREVLSNTRGDVMYFFCLHFFGCSAEAGDGWYNPRKSQLGTACAVIVLVCI